MNKHTLSLRNVGTLRDKRIQKRAMKVLRSSTYAKVISISLVCEFSGQILKEKIKCPQIFSIAPVRTRACTQTAGNS